MITNQNSGKGSPEQIYKISNIVLPDINDSQNGKLLKGKEVAKQLNVSDRQAYLLMRKGELPVLRFGRSVRVKQEDLDEYIKNNTN